MMRNPIIFSLHFEHNTNVLLAIRWVVSFTHSLDLTNKCVLANSQRCIWRRRDPHAIDQSLGIGSCYQHFPLVGSLSQRKVVVPTRADPSNSMGPMPCITLGLDDKIDMCIEMFSSLSNGRIKILIVVFSN